MSERISIVFDAIARLGIKLGTTPANSPDHWVTYKVAGIRGGEWVLHLNGERETRKDPEGCDTPPFHASVYWNGWPAGIMHPMGGILAAGSEANEETLILAIEQKIAQLEAAVERS